MRLTFTAGDFHQLVYITKKYQSNIKHDFF